MVLHRFRRVRLVFVRLPLGFPGVDETGSNFENVAKAGSA